MTKEPYTLHELNIILTDAIASLTPEAISVTGTLTSWERSRAWQRGELVTHQDNTVASKLPIGCSARQGVGISRTIAKTGQTLTPPIDVTMTGHIEFHERYGLRFHVKSIDPNSVDTAATQLERDELVATLKERGLYDRQRQLPTPTHLDNIGLITPQSGAAGREDALQILSPLNKDINELRVPTANAASPIAIAKAISSLESRSDIIAIVRGGGASSDLYVWDHETVVNAIALCTTPIVVGVGHATDDHIARQVAWHTANTPTAAAQHIANLMSPPEPLGTPVYPAPQTIKPQDAPPPMAPTQPRMLTVQQRRRRRITFALATVTVIAVVMAAYLAGANAR